MLVLGNKVMGGEVALGPQRVLLNRTRANCHPYIAQRWGCPSLVITLLDGLSCQPYVPLVKSDCTYARTSYLGRALKGSLDTRGAAQLNR